MADPLLRLVELWPYLPAFRAVAETEHLPSAAERLHVTPSALSRSIALLERRLGHELFERQRRRIQLNRAGQTLLDTLRRAMRVVDDGVTEVLDEQLRGPIRVVSASQLASTLLMRALGPLRRAHPMLQPELSSGGGELTDRLLRGEVDVAMAVIPGAHPSLQVVDLGRFGNGVYCGRGHPLQRRRKLSDADVSAYPFVAPPRIDGPPLDGWPPDLTREVAMRSDQMLMALTAVSDGELLGVFPDAVVAAHGEERGLRRLPWERLPPTRVHATIRTPLQPVGGPQALVEALKRVAKGLCLAE